jgi:ABC-type dipeptide/oligopeptide/nickel transport system ATPase component
VVEPRLFICDEITSALDVSIQAVIKRIDRRARAESGRSMLFVTHDLALVGGIAERVSVLIACRMVETGPADVVLRNLIGAEAHELLAHTPTLQNRPNF